MTDETPAPESPASPEAVHVNNVTTLKARIEADLAELETEIEAEAKKGSGFATRELAVARTKLQEGLHWIEDHLKKLL